MAEATTTPRQWDPERIYRQSVRLGPWLVAALALAGFARFPRITGSPLPYGVLALAALAIVAAACWVALRLIRADASGATARHALAIAVPATALWLAYILFTHLALKDSQKPTVGAALTWITLGTTTALIVAVSALGARGSGRITAGVAIGWCGGVFAGLFALFGLLFMLDLAMPLLVRHMNAGELRAYLASGWPDRAAWYYWNEEFYGSIGYFGLLALLGAVAGTVGGAVGRVLARGGR
jgi:hypothetical protein